MSGPSPVKTSCCEQSCKGTSENGQQSRIIRDHPQRHHAAFTVAQKGDSQNISIDLRKRHAPQERGVELSV